MIGTPDEDLSAHVDEVKHCCVLDVDGPAHLELREIVIGSLRGSAFRESGVFLLYLFRDLAAENLWPIASELVALQRLCTY